MTYFPVFALLLTVNLGYSSFWRRCDLAKKEKLHLKSFHQCPQSKLNDFYLTLSAGSIIPDGAFDGRVQMASNHESKILRFLDDFLHEPQEIFLERFWGGKTFTAGIRTPRSS